jgi:hypothetical protein
MTLRNSIIILGFAFLVSGCGEGGKNELMDIVEMDFGEGDIAYAANFPVEPYGSALFAAEDSSDTSKAKLKEVIQGWPELWPDIRKLLTDGIEHDGLEIKLGSDDFIGFVTGLEEDVYKGDVADTFLRIEFVDPPVWDFFIQGDSIVHSQPVY